eukprot:TRINITY_DN10200_c0_g2_i1.p1 TRINITY_DN10200_c0_g2~~TRINITY_DN10200_c0_g2_i1.p1  ORF type:complete len:437 (+),score=61.76 TRINITY_DN10200_c0_g2_i1:71-1381(+)
MDSFHVKLCLTVGIGYWGRVPDSQGLYKRGMGMLAGLVCWAISALLEKTIDVKELLALLTAGLIAEALRLPWDKWPLERWLDSVEPESAIEPDRPMIDPHHHLWDPLNQPKGWPIPGFVLSLMKVLRPHFIFAADEPMRGTFGNRHPICHTYMAKELYEDIHNNGKGHNIVGTVYMECGWKEPHRTPEAMIPTGEADMAFEANKVNSIICKAVVCHADLMLGEDVEPALKYYKERGVTGIRYSLAYQPPGAKAMGAGPKKDVRSEKFLKGFALLEKYDLSYDCWLFHTELNDLIYLAQKFPNTTIICDHVALPIPEPNQNTRATWKLQMQTLSACPNVRVKLSGMGMAVTELGFDKLPKPATSSELAQGWAPYYLHVICCFGSNRCMFASNFPVDKVSGGYTTHFNAHKLIVKDLPEEDKHNLFYQTAVDTYKIKI